MIEADLWLAGGGVEGTGGRRGWITKGQEGTLGGDGNGHCLDCSGSFTNIDIYKHI